MGTRLVVIALAVLAAAAAAGCDTIADGNIFEAKIQDALAEKGIVVTADCPDRIRLGKVSENKFQCDVVVTATGERGALEVELDAAGNLRWKPVDQAAAATTPP